MAVGGENIPETERDAGSVLESYGVDEVERLEVEPEDVLADQSEEEPADEPDGESSETIVENEVETLLGDLGETDLERTDEPAKLESTESDPIVGVFVSDPTTTVSEEDAAAIDELFEELEANTPGGNATETTSSDETTLVGEVGTETRVSEDSFGADAAVQTDPTDQSNRPPAKRRSAVREDEMEVGDQSDERDPEQGVERRIREIPDEPDPDRLADHPANGLSKRVSSLLDDDSVDEDDSRRHIARGESAGQVSAEQLAENLSTEAAEALSEAEAEIDEYKSNVLYDAHPDETSFEWVADDDVTSKWSSS